MSVHGMTYAQQGLSIPTRQQGASVQRNMGVPAFWFARAIEYGSQEILYEPYKDSAWVRRAIKHVAGPIAGVELVFTNPKLRVRNGKRRTAKRVFTSRGIRRREDEAEVELPQMRDFLRSPMRGLTYEDFVEASIGWFKLQECFWVLDDRILKPFPEASTQPLQQIMIARPDRMRHIVEGGELIGWEYRTTDGRAWQLLPEQVIRMYGWNPYSDWRGLGDYPSAHVAAESDWLAGKFTRNLMANNGDTGPIISPDTANGGPVPTDDQREQIIMALKEKRAAQLRGEFRPVFMPSGVSVEDPSIKSPDAAFMTGRLENRHEIYAALGVPPSLADVKAAYSIGSASDFYQLILNSCIPEGKKFCAALEVLIAKLTGQSVEVGLDWDEHPVLQEVRKERLTSADSLFAKGMPVRQISDYLGLDLPDFEGDATGYVPINITPVGDVKAEPAPADNQDFAEIPEDQAQVNPVNNMLRALSAPLQRAPKDTKVIWENHKRKRVAAVRLVKTKCSKLFNEYRARALQRLTSANLANAKSIATTKSLVDILFDGDHFGVDLFKALDPIERAILQSAGIELLEEIGDADNPWKMPPHEALRFIAGREQEIKKVGQTARDQINTAINEGLEKGEGTQEIATRIRGVFNNLQNFEAKRVALTETNMAYSFSRHQAMTDAGIEYKAWLSSHGPTVRDTHAQAEDDYIDDPIPIDEAFEVGGQRLMYPGDDSLGAGPEEIINCHCINLAAEKKSDNGKSVTYHIHGVGNMTFKKR